MAFWKGTPFPQSSTFTPDQFKEFEEVVGQMIVNGLRMGDSLEEQANNYKTQMDQIESWFCDWYKANRDGQLTMDDHANNDRLSVDIEKIFGLSIDKIGFMWYANLAALLKMNKIQNNENFGWLIIDEKVGTALLG